MASELAQGSYYIRTQASETGSGDALYLTTTSDKLTDGDNVYLAEDADGIGQEWFVDYIKTVDGQRIYEIRNRWSCKNLDLAYDEYTKQKGEPPFNAQIYSDQNKAWQRWNIADTGRTKKIDGVTYPVYAVYSRVDGTGTKYMLDAKGKTAGSNVQVGQGDLDTTRRWVFIPMPKFKAGQIYEVRSMLAPKKLALATQKGATANGSNVFVDGLDQTSNAQKWAFVKDGSNWLIRNIASGKYLDVKAAKVADFANGLNAQVYKLGGKSTDNATLHWVVNVADETESIGGVDRAIIGLKPGGDADGKYALDVASAHKTAGTNVQIYEANATQAQRWALVKTDATDPNMPAPTSIHLAKNLGGNGYQTISCDAAHYITWKCADSWVTGSNSNGYKLRWRTRDMAPHTSAWGDWGDWKTWRWVAPYTQSSRYWYTKSLDFAYEWAEAKNRQVEVQLVAQTAIGESLVTSEKADQIINLSRCPSVAVKGCAWSYDGLHVTMESDYNGYGKVRINLKKLVFTTKKGVKLSALKKNVSVMAKRASKELMSFTIPESYLTGNPAEGSEASFRFTIGSDQYDELSDDVTQTSTVSYESGTAKMTVTVSDTKSLMKKVVVDKANTVRCWVKLGTTATELSGKVNDDGETVFKYAYPFGTDYEFFISYTDDDDSATWAVATEEIDGSEGIRAHVWNWDDGYLVLWLNTDTVSESRSYSTEAETHVLSGREHPVVSFLASHGGRNFTSVTSTVEGVLLANDKYGCTVDDVEELLAEGHVTYRSPNGRIATVAVTGADVTQRKQFSTVSIEQTEEQL